VEENKRMVVCFDFGGTTSIIYTQLSYRTKKTVYQTLSGRKIAEDIFYKKELRWLAPLSISVFVFSY